MCLAESQRPLMYHFRWPRRVSRTYPVSYYVKYFKAPEETLGRKSRGGGGRVRLHVRVFLRVIP